MKRATFLAITAALVLCGCEYIKGTDEHLKVEGQKAAAALLKDPSSAQFRNVKVSDKTVCGEMNGKNSFGAYTGFEPFMYEYARASLTPPGENYELFERANEYVKQGLMLDKANWLEKFELCQAGKLTLSTSIALQTKYLDESKALNEKMKSAGPEQQR